MEISLLNKYKPNEYFDMFIDDFTKELLDIYFENNNLRFIIHGNICSGKTSLIQIILKKYYKNNKEIEDNIIQINLLYELGINYYRNELKNYCQINNIPKNNIKKTIILEDLDNLNEQYQQIFNTFIDKYKNINFIISCTDIQKIKQQIINKLELIKLLPSNELYLKNIMKNIINKEKINLNEKQQNIIIKSSNLYIGNMINILEKIKLLNMNEYDDKIIDKISCNIQIIDFEFYIKLCKDKKLNEAIDFIMNIYNNGYSVIDILDEFFIYIKNYSSLIDEIKYKIVKLLCKYINIFSNIHEDSIELIFLTNNIILLF